MNTFVQSVTNQAKTANGAISHKSSLSACLDLFSMGVSSSDKLTLIANAMQEDLPLAIKTVMYLRDPRGGQGNKDIARALHQLVFDKLASYSDYLAKHIQLLPYLPEIGSWKDVYDLYGKNKKVDTAILNLVSSALTDGNSLCAKWFPRQSQFHKDLAKFSGLDVGAIRRWVTSLTSVVETAMCNKQWHTINYNHVPSRANLVYSKAFLRNDNSRRMQYLAEAEAGKQNIKASVLYPHEISANLDASSQALWNALPNYMQESEKFNVLPIIDVSYSMTDNAYSKYSCMDIAVGLGLYLAERNVGAYKDLVCTFHDNPRFHKLTSNSLKDRVRETKNLPWGGSTNLQATFDLILQSAKTCNKEDLPKVIFLVSDMEFNSCGSRRTNFQEIQDKFTAAGIDMPLIVFWRVDVKVSQQPVTMTDNAVLINGYSPSICKTILSMKLDELRDMTPMKMYLNALGTKYNFVDTIFGA